MNSYCRRVVEWGRFSQEEVDCYNSLFLNGVFNLDFLLPDGKIYTYLDPKALCEMIEDTNSYHNQLELIVWFPTRKIDMLDEDCDVIYVSDLIRRRHWFFRHVRQQNYLIITRHRMVTLYNHVGVVTCSFIDRSTSISFLTFNTFLAWQRYPQL